MEENIEMEKAFLAVTDKAGAQDLLSTCKSEKVMFSTHNPDGLYNDVSKTCENLIGYTPKELIGTSPYDYFLPEDFQKILKSHAKVTIRPEIDRVEYRIKMKDGNYKKVRSLSRQVKDPTGLELILVVTFDEE